MSARSSAFVRILGTILAIVLTFSQSIAQSAGDYMLVGTYTNTDSKGIYVYSFDPGTGSITEVSTQGGIKNPSYLTIHNDNIYAVSETNGAETGSVSSYYFDRKTGSLRFLNNASTQGDDPCYVETDKAGNFVGVANYSSGSLILFKTKDDGSLTNDPQFIKHKTGSNVNPGRQKDPHVHETVFSPDQRFLLTPDLGKDQVTIYKFDPARQRPLILADSIVTDPGSGPRHIIFHPFLQTAYIINELSGTVASYRYAGSRFTKMQELPTWKKDFTGRKDGAEVKVSPDGKFLYVSNRGDQNSIAIFAINPADGQLTVKDIVSSGGKGPRDFEIDPSGNFLLAANQGSNNIVTFRIDKETGLLTEVGEINVPIPVCIKFTHK